MNDAEAVIRSAYAAMDAGDYVRLLNLCAPDVEWRFCGPTLCARKGHEGVAEWLMQLEPHLQNVCFTPRTFHAAGDTILVIGQADERAAPDAPWRSRARVHVWTLRNGRIARGTEYDATVPDPPEAAG